MRFNIWMEGYLCTGMDGCPQSARYLGNWDGETFKKACCNWAKATATTTFDSNKLTNWGCKLFDNEIDARNQFG